MRRALCSPQRPRSTFLQVFACFQVSTELCLPQLTAGCCHLVFVEPYHSLLFHLSLFSVIALLRTAVVFSTLDRFPLLWSEHEDDRDTLCIAPELKRDRGFRCYRSHHCLFLHHHPFFFIIISIRRRCKIFSHPPSFHLFVNSSLFLCVRCRTLDTEANIHDFGVRSPLNGLLTTASMIALLTTP